MDALEQFEDNCESYSQKDLSKMAQIEEQVRIRLYEVSLKAFKKKLGRP